MLNIPFCHVRPVKCEWHAGLAANFAMVGMGTDTGNSIRGPAGWNSLVGIRASLGLTSRSANSLATHSPHVCL